MHLKQIIESSFYNASDTNNETQFSNLLTKLKNSAKSNLGIKVNRYDKNLKTFSTYLFIIGGRLLYETGQYERIFFCKKSYYESKRH